MNKVIDLIRKTARELFPRAVDLRRSFHRYPETGWNEYRTASLIAEILEKNGWTVKAGVDLTRGRERLGLPGAEVRAREYERAYRDGAVLSMLPHFKDGHTAVLGFLDCGEGPVTLLRFDMDALPIMESQRDGYRPVREGFVSRYPGVMHACGHDGHAAVGALLSEGVTRLRSLFRGKIVLLFQPAEEGVRGASSLLGLPLLEQAGNVLGFHLLSAVPSGMVVPALSGIQATTKHDYIFQGKAAHAGGDLRKGRNALLAASRAVVDIYEKTAALSEKGRVHVGVFRSGCGRNIIADHAELSMESRGDSDSLNAFISEQAWRTARQAASLFGCTVTREKKGESSVCLQDDYLREVVKKAARDAGARIYPAPFSLGGSEDFSLLARKAACHHGRTLYFGIGAGAKEGPWYAPHTSEYDIKEEALETSLALLLALLHRTNGEAETV
jgi:aminobenzoyl-glutamate utilization protein A